MNSEWSSALLPKGDIFSVKWIQNLLITSLAVCIFYPWLTNRVSFLKYSRIKRQIKTCRSIISPIVIVSVKNELFFHTKELSWRLSIILFHKFVRQFVKSSVGEINLYSIRLQSRIRSFFSEDSLFFEQVGPCFQFFFQPWIILSWPESFRVCLYWKASIWNQFLQTFFIFPRLFMIFFFWKSLASETTHGGSTMFMLFNIN